MAAIAKKKAAEAAEVEHYEHTKRVVLYFDLWEAPPSFSTRYLFMKQVLLPKIEFVALQSTLAVCILDHRRSQCCTTI
jgi:hypothetical protein